MNVLSCRSPRLERRASQSPYIKQEMDASEGQLLTKLIELFDDKVQLGLLYVWFDMSLTTRSGDSSLIKRMGSVNNMPSNWRRRE